MIDQSRDVFSVRRQCALMQLSRSAVYYKDRINEQDIIFANLISELWLKMPSYGYRRITADLQRRDYNINHKRVLRLMRESKIQAIYPRPNTSMCHSPHKCYPYLLNQLNIDRPNQVWATDITYIKIPGGWIYLVALIDLYSRKIMGWRLSNTLDVAFCLDMLEDTLRIGKPEILNTDQGAQYTSAAWINMVEDNNIKISMDGKGRWADNVIIERFWRTLKHEHVLLHVFDTVAELKNSIKEFIYIYNNKRLHQNLGYKTPAEVYCGIAQAPILKLGKNKQIENVDMNVLAQIIGASSGGLLSSPFLRKG